MKEDLNTLARREAITDLLRERNNLSVKEAAACFHVSDMTIRRDFHILQGQGIVNLYHGGARLRSSALTPFTFEDRSDRMAQEKQIIAHRACSFLKQDTVIYLDSSTTVLQMVRFFPDIRITVVTSSLKAAHILSAYPNVRLYIAGGRFDAVFDGSADYSTIEYTDRFHFDQAYFGAGFFSLQEGITSRYEYEALLKTHILSHTRESFFLIDHTKFGRYAPFRIADSCDVTAIITDPGLPEEERTPYKKKEIRLLYADGSGK